MALESIEEHHIVKWVLSELEHKDPHDESFDAKVTVLIENVRHHVKEEEGDYFPRVRGELGRNALTELGDVMSTARSKAPIRPHPRSPSTPPANVVANKTAGVVDRVEDTVSGLAAEGAAALRSAIERLHDARARRTDSTVHRGAGKGRKPRIKASAAEKASA